MTHECKLIIKKTAKIEHVNKKYPKCSICGNKGLIVEKFNRKYYKKKVDFKEDTG